MSMTIPEAHALIAKTYDDAAAIENKYPGGLTIDVNKADFEERNRLLETVDGLEEKLSGLEDADQQKRRILDGQKRRSQPTQQHPQPDGDLDDRSTSIEMYGSEFVDSDEYKSIVASGVLHNPSSRVEFGVQLKHSLLPILMRKALAYSGTGVGGNNLIQNQRIPGLDFLFRETTLLDMIPTARTTSNMIEYYEMTTSTNNAAFVAEASVTTGTTGLKPEGAIGWSLRTSPVSTLAEWLPVTNQFLADAPAVEGMIREQLLTHLQLALETGIISGNGTAPNLLGILNTPNVQTLGVTTTVADAALNAMNQISVTGLGQANVVVMHPSDWTALRLLRESTVTGNVNPGGYLYGPPSVAGPMTLWGRPVVLSLGLTENTMLVGDFSRGCMLFDREQSAIRVGTINDQFVRNMLTILAELRAAFAVFRPLVFAKVTGV
jgi:HK97 family phage major capsid protein